MSSMGAVGGAGAAGAAAGGGGSAMGGGVAVGGVAATGQAAVTVGMAVSAAKSSHASAMQASQANYQDGRSPSTSGPEQSTVHLSSEACALYGMSVNEQFSDLVAAALLAVLLKQKEQEEGISAYALAAIATYNAVQSMQSAPSMSMSA